MIAQQILPQWGSPELDFFSMPSLELLKAIPSGNRQSQADSYGAAGLWLPLFKVPPRSTAATTSKGMCVGGGEFRPVPFLLCSLLPF